MGVALDMDVKAVMNCFIPTRSALRALTLCALLGATAYATIPAQAKTNFDGNWSVVIITEQGTCDRSYAIRCASAAAPSDTPARRPLTSRDASRRTATLPFR